MSLRHLESVTSDRQCDSVDRLVHIYAKNISAKLHPDPIRNDGALSFSEETAPNKKKNNKVSSDMRSSSRRKNYQHSTASYNGPPTQSVVEDISLLGKLLHAVMIHEAWQYESIKYKGHAPTAVWTSRRKGGGDQPFQPWENSSRPPRQNPDLPVKLYTLNSTHVPQIKPSQK